MPTGDSTVQCEASLTSVSYITSSKVTTMVSLLAPASALAAAERTVGALASVEELTSALPAAMLPARSAMFWKSSVSSVGTSGASKTRRTTLPLCCS